jgi:hypothetical protein
MIGTAEICIAYWTVTEYPVKPVGKFWMTLTYEMTEKEVKKQIEDFGKEDLVATEPEKMVWRICDYRGFSTGVKIAEDAELEIILNIATSPF